MTAASGARVPGALAVFGLMAVALLTSSGPVAGIEVNIVQQHVQLLGEQECTYGPAFWCQNLTNAAGCNAVSHCIQTTWETQTYPEDNDDICTICKNMVKEARDTLTSNVTLDELKQVFYGSCQLLPLKVIKTECKKLADSFIPELVDTLASEMDPNVVCTVSGLCNNAHIDKFLLENKEKVQPKMDGEYHACEQCAIVMDKGEHLVQRMSQDNLINRILMMCGELSSYSDACSSIVLTYNNEIYNSIQSGFTKRNVCMLSGMCSEAFHPHADGHEKSKNALMGVEISSAGERGRIQVQKPNEVSEELTCEFCETMVKHLRDILVANTTEDQFLDVLKGLCKQTKSFSDECLSLVDENSARIYQFLVSELDGKVLCTVVGICPKSPNTHFDLDYFVPMFPLLPVDLLQIQESLRTDDDSLLAAKKEQNNQKPVLVVDELPPKVLDIKFVKKSPIIEMIYKETHVVVNDVDMPSEKTICFLCQSVLNYVQQVVTDPKSEEEIRTALEKSCAVVPSSFEQQCKQFVDQYGDAFISLIAQEVDPSVICPELKLCPAIDLSLVSNKPSEKSNNCPLCVIFMSALESEITKKDTEEVIKTKLDKLCTKLPTKWKAECIDFVSNQFQSILDMLVAEVKPEEICVMLEICKPKTLLKSDQSELETNMVVFSDQVTLVFPGNNIGQLLANNYKMLEEPKVPTPFCLVCTVVMKYVNGEIKDKSNQEEIEHILDATCSILPNVEENECQTFVSKNYLSIVKAIQIGTNPTIACMAMMVCDKTEADSVKNIFTTEPKEVDKTDECTACEAFASVFGDRLSSNKPIKIEDMDLVAICYEVETAYKEQCLEMINSYAPSFKNIYNHMPTWMMCEEMSLCSKNKSSAVQQLSNVNCLKGVEYWCASLDNAKECKVNFMFLMLRIGCRPLTRVPVSRSIVQRSIEVARDTCTIKNCGDSPTVRKFHPKCSICKDVIRDIKQKVKASPMEVDIKYRLESLCDPLPNKDACVTFVEKYTEKFLNTLIDDIKEGSVCKEIGYCRAIHHHNFERPSNVFRKLLL